MKSAVGSRRVAVIVAICLLAFGLRAFHLETQSLWYDEGLSVYLASLPPQATVETSAITDHPPLHALMLGAWMRVAGRSELAIRFISVWWSVLAVALIWRVGRELLTDAIGAVGALLMATSAFAVWYAQEVRGYSMLLALTLVAAWAFAMTLIPGPSPSVGEGRSPRPIRERGQGRGWAWIALVVSGIAALYTHYYAAFTLLALNLAFLAVLACRIRHALPQQLAQHTIRHTPYAIHFYFSQLAILAGFAPWLPAVIRQATTNTTYFPGRVGWQTVVGDTLRVFTTGDVAPTTLAAVALSVMGVLAVIGALAEQPGTTRLNRVITALLVAAPVTAMAVIAWNKPKFAPRYLIEALPAIYLLVGAGFTAANRQRISGWVFFVLHALVIVGAIILIVTGAFSLRATYFDPARQRPDMRGVAAYIAANEQRGDVIVLLGGYQSPVFDFYYHGENPIAPMPEGVMPPAQSPLDYRAARQLEEIARGHGRLWLALWQRELADPTDVVLSELLAKSRRLGVGQDFHDMRLLLFDLQDHRPLGDDPQHPMDVRFTEPIALAGYDLSATSCAPGESLDLALYWRASGRIAGNYVVFTHLLAPDGRMVAGSDHIAGADSYPASLWTEGALVRNTFTLRVPPDASPGTFTIQVGLYDPQGRLKLADGTDRILLAEIVVK
jgi:mannosyltransferase